MTLFNVGFVVDIYNTSIIEDIPILYLRGGVCFVVKYVNNKVSM